MTNKTAICPVCQTVFEPKSASKYCSAKCRLKANGRMSPKPRQRKKPSLSLAQINELARAEGLNYGQYVAKYGL